MPARTNALRKYTAKRVRRRTSNLTKTRFQAPTARNQKRQILTNAKAISRVYKMLPSPSYCDWQLSGTHESLPNPGDGYTNTTLATPLLDPFSWNSVLRKDPVVDQSSTTCVKRMVINMRYFLQDSTYTQMSVFIVTLRKDASNRQIDLQPLTEKDDFIYGGENDWNVRLNPSVFKVHFARYITLTNNVLLGPSSLSVGNPRQTYGKGQVTIPLNVNIREPNGLPWKSMQRFQLPPRQRYYLLSFQSTLTPAVGAPSPARITYDVLATTYNVG